MRSGAWRPAGGKAARGARCAIPALLDARILSCGVQLAEAIVAKHPLARVHVVRVDVAVHAEVGAMVDEVERMLGPVDVLVNNGWCRCRCYD